MNDQLVRDGRAPVIGQVDRYMRLSKPDIPWRGRHHGGLGNEVRVERRYSVAAEALVRLSHCNILGRHQHLVELLARARHHSALCRSLGIYDPQSDSWAV